MSAPAKGAPQPAATPSVIAAVVPVRLLSIEPPKREGLIPDIKLEGRFVIQRQLDKAQGVVPAQLIFSFEQARRTAIVTAAGVPAAFRAAFPYRTRAANNSSFDFGGLPLLRGIPSREAHNLRSEFATIFNF